MSRDSRRNDAAADNGRGAQVDRDEAAAAMDAAAGAEAEIPHPGTVPLWYFVALGLYLWIGSLSQLIPQRLLGDILRGLLTVAFFLVLWRSRRFLRLHFAGGALPRRAVILFVVYLAAIIAVFLGGIAVELGSGWSHVSFWTGGLMFALTVVFGLLVNRAMVAHRTRASTP